jgi:cell division protein FtsZ
VAAATRSAIDCGVQGVEFICANTDAQALSPWRGPDHQLGGTGLGAERKPDRREAAELMDDIRGAASAHTVHHGRHGQRHCGTSARPYHGSQRNGTF